MTAHIIHCRNFHEVVLSRIVCDSMSLCYDNYHMVISMDREA